MQESEEVTARARDYFPLLGLILTGVLGMSLLCGAAAVGINDINNAVPLGTPTVGVIDFVISNMSTMIVQTAQAFSVPEIDGTLTPTSTATVTASNTAANTATSLPIINFFVSTSTHLVPQHSNNTSTPIPLPTSTTVVIPTRTPMPTSTTIPNTITPIPPTDVPPASPTDIPTVIPPTSYP